MANFEFLSSKATRFIILQLLKRPKSRFRDQGASKDPPAPLGSPALGQVSFNFSQFSLFPDLLEVGFELLSSKAARFTLLELLGRLKKLLW